MRARGKPPHRGLVWWAAGILLAVALAVQAVRMAIAHDAVRNRNGQLAAKVRPQNGEGLALRAEQYLARNDPSAAAAESLAALDRTPLSALALRTLAQARDKMSGPGSGEAAWQAASMLGWRDKQTQLWALLRALSNGEATILAMRADALLRTGDPDGSTTAMLRQFMIEPEVRAAFIERLRLNPSWRRRFLTVPPSARGQDLDGLLSTLQELDRTDAPPTRVEIRGAVDALISRRRFADAIALKALITRPANGSSLLDDGGFERNDLFYRREASQFDWNITSGHNAAGNLDESEGGHIAVSASGRSPEVALYRYVPLEPGPYRLIYSVRGGTSAPASIGIWVSCAGGSKLAESSPEPLASGGWQRRQLTFRIDENCPIAVIEARGLGTEEGEAQFDNFILQRMVGSPPPRVLASLR